MDKVVLGRLLKIIHLTRSLKHMFRLAQLRWQQEKRQRLLRITETFIQTPVIYTLLTYIQQVIIAHLEKVQPTHLTTILTQNI